MSYQIWLFCGLFENVHHRPIPSLRHSRICIAHLYTSSWAIIHHIIWKRRKISVKTNMKLAVVECSTEFRLNFWSRLLLIKIYQRKICTTSKKICTVLYYRALHHETGFRRVAWKSLHDWLIITEPLSDWETALYRMAPIWKSRSFRPKMIEIKSVMSRTLIHSSNLLKLLIFWSFSFWGFRLNKLFEKHFEHLVFLTWWNLSFYVWFRIYYSGYSSGSWSIRQLGTFLVNFMFR